MAILPAWAGSVQKRGELMRLLAIGRPRGGADVRQIAHYAREEMRALWQLYRDGVVREMYSPGRPGAVLVLETAARKDAEAVLAGLPLAAAGVISFDLIELHPFSAFEVLFADDART
jgi:hypothetical protein